MYNRRIYRNKRFQKEVQREVRSLSSEKRVITTQNYASDVLYNDINILKETYPFIETGEIGRSVLNKSIPYIKIGTGGNKVFYSAAIHANEWITAPILMKYLEECCLSLSNNDKLFGYDANAVFNKATLYVVPMVNPDGVDLVTGGIQPGDRAYEKARIIANNFPNINFPERMESKY